MALKNSSNSYGWVSYLFHWMMAIIIVGLIMEGFYMVYLPLGSFSVSLFGWHKSFGLFVLFLCVLRLLWRWSNPVPKLPVAMPASQQVIVHLGHYFFYFLMVSLPISGWLETSAAGMPASFFGLFVMPNITRADESHRVLFLTIHHLIAYTILGMLFLHIAASLKHHFINRDNILRRMLWP